MKLKQRFQIKRWYRSLAFGMPLLFALPAFVALGLAPFGSRSLLGIDAWGQYFPMLKEMRRAIVVGNVGYSFHGGLGFNLWAQSAYYTNSPLWALLYVIPESWMIAGVDLIVLAKFGLCGLTFALCWERISGRRDWIGVVFGLGYALCAYNLAFVNQFMWADVVVLFPLVVRGLWELCENKSGVGYLLALATAIFSNFYIGYMACIGSVCFFVLFELKQKRTWREHGNHVLRFGLYSLFAGGIGAVSLVPVWLCLQQAKSSQMGFGGVWEWYHSAGDFLVRLLPFGQEALAYEAPNLYTGLGIVIFAGFFLVSKRMSWRLRLGAGVLVCFLLLSFNLNGLDYIWHGFHYPNQLPGRQSFLFSFIVALMGAFGFTVWRRGRKRSLVRMTLLVLALEVGVSGMYMLVTQTRKTSAVDYVAMDADMSEAISEFGPKATNFYRVERLPRYNFNPGQQYGYPGVTYYSSTMSGNAYDFLGRLGLPIYARNVSTLYEQTPILNMMFGVRYLFDSNGENGDATLETVGQVGCLTIRENGYWLPLAFRVDESILTFAPEEGRSGIANQNAWVKATGAVAQDILRELPSRQKQAFAWELDREMLATAWEALADEGCLVQSNSRTRIEAKITCREAGILHTTLPNDGGWRIFIDGEQAEVLELAGYLCGARITAGEHDLVFQYEVPGLRIGAALSIISMFGAGVLIWREYMEKRRGDGI